VSFRCLMSKRCLLDFLYNIHVLVCIFTLYYIFSIHLRFNYTYNTFTITESLFKFAAQCDISLDKVSDWSFPKCAQEHTLVFISWLDLSKWITRPWIYLSAEGLEVFGWCTQGWCGSPWYFYYFYMSKNQQNTASYRKIQ